jgi:hypothetical protein
MKDKDMLEARELTKIALDQPLQQQSELTGVMKELNEDVLEQDTKLPSIDMKTRLMPFEITSMVIHDAVVNLRCLPKDCLITTRTKKRLAVSLKGMGRQEMVRIVQTERNKEQGEGFFSRMKNVFTPAKE